MNVASLELCRELFALSGWLDTYAEWLSSCEFEDEDKYSLVPNATEKSVKNGEGYPAYDLGYLLRKLPQNTWVGYVDTSGRRDYALAKTYAWNEKGTDIDEIAECRADTPEDAACKLAIELFRMPQTPAKTSETKRYTWEEKIESLVKLAKAAGRFLNTDQGTEGYKATRGHLFAIYAEFCEWRLEEPYVIDEIKALMQPGQAPPQGGKL